MSRKQHTIAFLIYLFIQLAFVMVYSFILVVSFFSLLAHAVSSRNNLQFLNWANSFLLEVVCFPFPSFNLEMQLGSYG